jgi:hypothetical protein
VRSNFVSPHAWESYERVTNPSCKSRIGYGQVVAFVEYIYLEQCRIPADIGTDFIERNRVFVSDFILAGFAVKKIKTLFDQPENLSTYFSRLSTPINGWINWSSPPT